MKKIKRLFLIILLAIISNQILAQKEPNIIFFYKPYTDSIENNLYIKTLLKFNYKTQYNNVKSADINGNLNRAIQRNDYRFIALSGNSYVLPGLQGYTIDKNGHKGFGYLKKYEKYIAKYRFKVVEGTSDAIDANLPSLQSVASDFAKKYNKLMILKIEKLENKRR